MCSFKLCTYYLKGQGVKSGLLYFDDALGGRGFTPSAVTLFTGTPGAGKTTMMLELANSLTGHGGAVLFNTAEESLYQLKMTVERLRLRSGFIAGQETNVPRLLRNCDRLRECAYTTRVDTHAAHENPQMEAPGAPKGLPGGTQRPQQGIGSQKPQFT